MKLASYFRKLYLTIGSSWFKQYSFLEPNLYLFNLDPSQLPKLQKICFELNNSEFMHLGDHLFFLPLIKSFQERGYQVEARVSPAMYPVFKKLGLPVVLELAPYEQYDLVISRFELMTELSHFKTLLVHVSQNLTMPICSQLLSSFSRYFDKPLNSRVNFKGLTNPEILLKLGLPQNKKLLLFNPYCNSSSYLINRAKKKRLVELVQSHAKDPEIKVVVLGTDQDKIKDKSQFKFEHFDLRGKTTALDIFELVNNPRTTLYVGFDAFVMHVFSLLGKNSWVLFRGRLTKKQSEMLKQFHVNLFSDHQFVTLV